MALLDVQQLGIAFGGLTAVRDFQLTLAPHTLHGLIGPNGAGKTTVFNLLSGLYTPDRGSITLRDRNLIGQSPSAIAAAGLARTFQNIRLCKQLSVLDNICIGGHVRLTHSMRGALLRTKCHRQEEAAQRTFARELLDLVHLTPHADTLAGNLAYGDQRRLELARALATQPQLLLLDEPAAGMNPQEKQALAQLISTIRTRFHLTILLIDHDMGLVMSICDRITVLDYGEIIACGAPAEVQNNPKVIEAYLGTPEH